MVNILKATRLSRIQFLFWSNIAIGGFLIGVTLSFVMFIPFLREYMPLEFMYLGIVFVLLSYFILCRSSVLRFRDFSMLGMPVFSYLTPLGPITFLMLLFIPGNKGENKYGSEPVKAGRGLVISTIITVPVLMIYSLYIGLAIPF